MLPRGPPLPAPGMPLGLPELPWASLKPAHTPTCSGRRALQLPSSLQVQPGPVLRPWAQDSAQPERRPWLSYSPGVGRPLLSPSLWPWLPNSQDPSSLFCGGMRKQIWKGISPRKGQKLSIIPSQPLREGEDQIRVQWGWGQDGSRSGLSQNQGQASNYSRFLDLCTIDIFFC